MLHPSKNRAARVFAGREHSLCTALAEADHPVLLEEVIQ